MLVDLRYQGLPAVASTPWMASRETDLSMAYPSPRTFLPLASNQAKTYSRPTSCRTSPHRLHLRPCIPSPPRSSHRTPDSSIQFRRTHCSPCSNPLCPYPQTCGTRHRRRGRWNEWSSSAEKDFQMGMYIDGALAACSEYVGSRGVCRIPSLDLSW